MTPSLTRISLGLAVLIGSSLTGYVSAQTQDVIIMGGRSQAEFLGCLTCNEYDSNSVWNEYSKHGWENKYGTWNKYGENAGRYGANSACNPYGTNGPALVDRQGNFYGRLTVNEYDQGSVRGISGVPQICRALKVMCAAE